eukprot:10650983-Karenia_brevis.AAC.2
MGCPRRLRKEFSLRYHATTARVQRPAYWQCSPIHADADTVHGLSKKAGRIFLGIGGFLGGRSA